MNYPIRYNGKLVTLRQVLINMRSTSDFGRNIFMQVDRTFNKAIVVICHKSDLEEAKRYAKHLCTLTEAFFGKSALHWFDTEAKKIAKLKTFNKVSKVIEATYDEDDLEIMNRIAAYTRSVNEQSKKVIKNGTEEPFELLDDSDDNSNIALTKDLRKVQLLYTYPLSSIFKLHPPQTQVGSTV